MSSEFPYEPVPILTCFVVAGVKPISKGASTITAPNASKLLVTENCAARGEPVNGPGWVGSDVINFSFLVIARAPFRLVMMSQKLLTTTALKLTFPMFPAWLASTGFGSIKLLLIAEQKKPRINTTFDLLLSFNKAKEVSLVHCVRFNGNLIVFDALF